MAAQAIALASPSLAQLRLDGSLHRAPVAGRIPHRHGQPQRQPASPLEQPAQALRERQPDRLPPVRAHGEGLRPKLYADAPRNCTRPDMRPARRPLIAKALLLTTRMASGPRAGIRPAARPSTTRARAPKAAGVTLPPLDDVADGVKIKGIAGEPVLSVGGDLFCPRAQTTSAPRPPRPLPSSSPPPPPRSGPPPRSPASPGGTERQEFPTHALSPAGQRARPSGGVGPNGERPVSIEPINSSGGRASDSQDRTAPARPTILLPAEKAARPTNLFSS